MRTCLLHNWTGWSEPQRVVSYVDVQIVKIVQFRVCKKCNMIDQQEVTIGDVDLHFLDKFYFDAVYLNE